MAQGFSRAEIRARVPWESHRCQHSSQEITMCDVTSEILEENRPDNEMKIKGLEHQPIKEIESVQLAKRQTWTWKKCQL